MGYSLTEMIDKDKEETLLLYYNMVDWEKTNNTLNRSRVNKVWEPLVYRQPSKRTNLSDKTKVDEKTEAGPIWFQKSGITLAEHK